MSFFLDSVLATQSYGRVSPTATLLLFVIAFLYSTPTIVASLRNHNQTAAIAVLNIFLGWTFVGWVVSLSWALVNDDK